MESAVAKIKASGVFDFKYYKRVSSQDVGELELIRHYVTEGELAGLRPAFVFDPQYYRQQNGIESDGQLLLVHYIETGEAAGLKPSPLFDPLWYANTFELSEALALSHYLSLSPKERQPNKYFDARFYLEHSPDVSLVEIDPYEHFIKWGVFEGRKCSNEFDANYVWSKYLNNDKSHNPFLVFLEQGTKFGWKGVIGAEEISLSKEIRRYQAPGASFDKELRDSSGVRKVKALAFYLPQFHAIPENDEWWGTGFTEWRNVPRGVPRFAGHYQPRIPRDLGYYDLADESVMPRQIDLARRAGIHGFCFYYYNFSGHRLLERPLDAFVANKDLDMPFCLLWANENWSRRWDGLEQEVLIGQNYSANDEVNLVDDVASYMKDPRYIRIGDRPLFFVYRSDVIPNLREVMNRWRQRFMSEHKLNPLIVMAQSFGVFDPRPGGFDGAVEFPPHKYGSVMKHINNRMKVLDPDFQGQVYDYDELIEKSLADFPKEYPLLKTVVPSWDNDARKQANGLCIHGSTPAKFQSWLEKLSAAVQVRPFHGERLIMVNAWNEWCEGAYLEPDVHFGFAYLNALSRALDIQPEKISRKVLLVGHDAFPAGAQMLLYNIGRALKRGFGIEVAFVLMDGGDLVEKYQSLARTFVVDATADFWPALRAEIDALRSEGYDLALTNSAFSGHCVAVLADNGFRVCSLIHELKTIITRYWGMDKYSQIAKRSNDVVFPNEYVKKEVTANFGTPSGTSTVMPQGLYKEIFEVPGAGVALRELLKLPSSSRIVVNTGYADLRKGVDLFMGLAREVALIDKSVHFVWVGNVDPIVDAWIVEDVRQGRVRNAHFMNFTDDIARVLSAADLFFLTSREDPFPSVVLEATALGLAVGAFDTGGGYVDFIRSNPFVGFLAPSNDLAEAARKIVSVLNSEATDRARHKPARQALIKQGYDFSDYCFSLFNILQPTQRVSVVVPNYNYKPYLRDRLTSIFNQTYPVYEVIVLDDCSTDDSIDELERLASSIGRDFVLIENDANSGNVFAQWKRGVEAAKGDLVWIAEADDLSDPQFLENLVPRLANAEVGMAFSDSRTIDEHGVAQWNSYKGYYNTLFPGALAESGEFEGPVFLRDYLSVKNVIMNVSSVLWRKAALSRALSACAGDLDRLKMAGDWRIYAEVCLQGQRVGYDAGALNVHRRHSTSVTHALKKETHRAEIAAMHRLVSERLGAAAPKDSQAEYLREISEQFGLQPA